MLFKLLNAIDARFEISKIDAHCDIPCRIYDPMTAQIAALSVVRLMDIMDETISGDGDALNQQNTIARCVGRKEEEAEKAKHEVRIIWGDYFKQPQFDAFPEIHEITHQIMLTASACKQGTTRVSGEKLVEQVNRFAEIYWHSKDIKTASYPCPYPPNLPTVYPILG
tara:strand:- start:601 stop:1101 length:501 start_codon:yes stop_codon:yes gene_type:complete